MCADVFLIINYRYLINYGNRRRAAIATDLSCQRILFLTDFVLHLVTVASDTPCNMIFGVVFKFPESDRPVDKS
jgi:hypothetical protein